MAPEHGPESGSALLMTVTAVTIAALMLGAIADLAVFMVARAKAQTAADAAALAAAGEMLPGGGLDPGAEAIHFARLNGSELVSCTCPPGGSGATVTVRIGVRFVLLGTAGARYVTARARADVEHPRARRQG